MSSSSSVLCDARLRLVVGLLLFPGSCAPLALLAGGGWWLAGVREGARPVVTPAARERGSVCACANRDDDVAPVATSRALDDLFPHLPQLARAVAEADLNCAVAERVARGEAPDGPGAFFRTRELRGALLDGPLVPLPPAELERLLDEADWLGGLEPGAPLGERTWEDVRFLLGALHATLERAHDAAWSRLAPGVEPPTTHRARPAADFDPAGRRAFATARSFEDVLRPRE